LMCSDDLDAEHAFAYYKEHRADLIVQISDSVNRSWQSTFPEFCRRFQLPAVVCNAAGIGQGRSMAIDLHGNIVPMYPDGDRSLVAEGGLGEAAHVGIVSLPLRN
jgi:hypothetical protein